MTTRRRTQNLKKLRNDLKVLVQDGENLLKSEGDNLSAKGEELRDQLTETLEAAQEYCSDLEAKARDQLEEIDHSVHSSPYQYMALACGVGLLLGLFVGRAR